MNNKISMKEFKFTPFTNFIFHLKMIYLINKGSIGSPYFLVIIILYYTNISNILQKFNQNIKKNHINSLIFKRFSSKKLYMSKNFINFRVSND